MRIFSRNGNLHKTLVMVYMGSFLLSSSFCPEMNSSFSLSFLVIWFLHSTCEYVLNKRIHGNNHHGDYNVNT